MATMLHDTLSFCTANDSITMIFMVLLLEKDKNY